jgi:Flp pilus assembly protein protease CpaA
MQDFLDCFESQRAGVRVCIIAFACAQTFLLWRAGYEMLDLICFAVLGLLLLASAVVDARVRIIPNVFMILGVCLWLGYMLMLGCTGTGAGADVLSLASTRIAQSLLILIVLILCDRVLVRVSTAGSAAASAPVSAHAHTPAAALSSARIGFGDIKLLGLLGLWTTPEIFLVLLCMSSLFGCITALLLRADACAINL